jgi:pimeloyl-ACP methyl ester carboxylesterase
MAKFILIHGAWHGAWCWERVVPLLEKSGHQVVAPDLPGMGADSDRALKVNFQDWITFTRELVKQQDEKVILLGHSRAGVLISQLAECCGDRLLGLVYLSAFLVPNGQCLWNVIKKFLQNKTPGFELDFAEKGRFSTVSPQVVRDYFYQLAESEWAEKAISKLTPEPMMSYEAKLQLTAERFGKVPRAYIKCLQDGAISLAFQNEMLAEIACEKVLNLDSDHSPFYSMPRQLVEKLVELAEYFESFKS